MVSVSITKGGQHPITHKEVKATALVEADNPQQYNDMVNVLSESNYHLGSSQVRFNGPTYQATLVLE